MATTAHAPGAPAAATAPRPPIRPRKMDFPFGSDIPRHWLGGSVLATALANSLNLLFPKGERFFVRSVRYFADRITDPQLAADVRGFIGQEVRHGIEHERFFDTMRAQGYDVDRFLALYEKLAFGLLEPVAPPKLRLAATAALEHFTAAFAEDALTSGVLEEYFHPTMRALLQWHAAEEIEHKAVAFDVLQQVDDGYALRMAGLGMATVTLLGFWVLGAAMLLKQEKQMTLRRFLHERREGRRRGQIGEGEIWRAVVEYVRPGFHPSQRDNYGLARDYFARVGPEPASA